MQENYSKILIKLKSIKTKLNKLSDYHNDILKNLNDNFIVDKKIVNKGTFDAIKDTNNECITELNDYIIPSVRRKI